MALFEGFERKQVDCGGGVTVNCVVGGKGDPILLLHGYPQTHAMWARVAPILAQTNTVVCADMRGYGDSSKPKSLPDRSNYSFRAMAADQAALMTALGFEQFGVVGHDRGARCSHRLTLDNPKRVRKLAVLDIVPTYTLLTEMNRNTAGAYWHWNFLSLPEPFPETLIGRDPDFFFETQLSGWGSAKPGDFDPEMFAEYRRCWNDPAMIHGSCSDYRAAKGIDFEHDSADLATQVQCPVLVFFGGQGVMAKFFDMEAVWKRFAVDVRTASLPAGHFFIDRFPKETADILGSFLNGTR